MPQPAICMLVCGTFIAFPDIASLPSYYYLLASLGYNLSLSTCFRLTVCKTKSGPKLFIRKSYIKT